MTNVRQLHHSALRGRHGAPNRLCNSVREARTSGPLRDFNRNELFISALRRPATLAPAVRVGTRRKKNDRGRLMAIGCHAAGSGLA
jgi:hypothetical protein